MFARLQSMVVRAVLRPENAAARLAERVAPVCYVLETSSDSDLNLLHQVCLRERLPRPLKRLPAPHQRERRSYFALSRPVGMGCQSRQAWMSVTRMPRAPRS